MLRPARRGRLAVLTLLLAAAAALAPASAEAKPAPNLVVITTDDQTLESMNETTMPFTSRFMAKQGTEFTNAIVVSPSCCPARAAYLTGQYPHNNGVLNNFPGYPSLQQKGNTLPVWLKRAGYRTAHVGKYLNRYGSVNGWATPGPGWDRWFTQITYRYYNYKIATGGRIKNFGARPRDYLTRRLNRKSARLLRRASNRKRPLYLQLDQFAPHSEVGETPGSCPGAAQPDPLDEGRFADAPLPQASLPADERSFNEEDVSDKSPIIASRRKLSGFVVDKIKQRYRCQLESLRAVDRGVRGIRDALRKAGALRRTAIVFTSDNGFFHGEHRIPNNKGLPYEEGIRVPLMVRLPPSLAPDPPSRLDEPVANIDITASLLDLAEAAPCVRRNRCRRLDGRPFVDLIRGTASWPEDRAILIEQERPQYFCAPYTAVWTPARMLAHFPTQLEDSDPCEHEVEHYDMEADPMQLENLRPPRGGSPRPQGQRAMERRLRKLRSCSGSDALYEARLHRPLCE
jgi:N-acetylglucosamine-6-sulfatase